MDSAANTVDFGLLKKQLEALAPLRVSAPP